MDINVINDKIVYEDKEVIVLMKKTAISNGHLLLVTKRNFNDFTEIDDETLKHIHYVLKEMKNLIYDRLNPNGLKLENNCGSLSKYNKFYIDIIPVYEPKQPLVDIDIIYDKLK